jgi:hypothetical protein
MEYVRESQDPVDLVDPVDSVDIAEITVRGGIARLN